MPEQLNCSISKDKAPLKSPRSENGTGSGELSSGFGLKQCPEDIWLTHMA